ncbi:MAG: FAD-dependent oxidoreductase, partial [Bacteroidia bacterium]|nr:FAD-dependent oxidoreductase [Bacteroidia bacterium]
MDIKKTDVIIIGAGLTGLSMAFYLKKNGIIPLVLEKADKPGGVIQTINE